MQEFKNMKDYLNSPKAAYKISGNLKDMFIKAIELMECHIAMMEDDKEVTDPQGDTVGKCINIIPALFLEVEMDESFKLFLRDFIFITYNWNNNLLKNDRLQQQMEYCQRFIQGKLTYTDLRTVLLDMTRMAGMTEKDRPIQFELSQHYFDLLEAK